MYDEDSNLDAHIIAFERVLQEYGEIDDSENIDIFGNTLKKPPKVAW